MKAFSLLCSLILLCLPAMGCLNETRLTLSGDDIEWNEEFPFSTQVLTPVGRSFKADRLINLKRLEELNDAYQTRHQITDYSDYGVVLVYLGRFEEARKVFEAIEAQKPGLYATAANLGTVYELLGRNNKALYWIEQAVAINPRSHKSSEWIHVNVLKAKIKGDGAINSRFLLGVDFGTADVPVSNDSLVALIRLRDQLYYQLEERMSFVGPPDKIVGQLLFDLGNLYALTSNIQSALEVYDKAKAYGYGGDVLDTRYAHLTWLTKKESYFIWVIFVTLLALVTAGIWVLVKRWRRRTRSANYRAVPDKVTS